MWPEAQPVGLVGAAVGGVVSGLGDVPDCAAVPVAEGDDPVPLAAGPP